MWIVVPPDRDEGSARLGAGEQGRLGTNHLAACVRFAQAVRHKGALALRFFFGFYKSLLRHRIWLLRIQQHYSTGGIFPLVVEPNSELAPWGKRSRPRGRRCYTSEMQDEAAQICATPRLT